ncbi:MAG: cryptochrome/photolyase family protein [Woeseia sp.]|nr:cryptochrome/photolyase family protein [Woeseia sp.]
MSSTRGLLLLGNQLFPFAEVKDFADYPVFMAEDRELCTTVRHHQQKLVLFLAAMREHASTLQDKGVTVEYEKLDTKDQRSYEDKLAEFVTNHSINELLHFEIEDHFFEKRIAKFCEGHDLKQVVIESPMFLTSRESFKDYLGDHKRPHMADFYKRQRRRMDIMVSADGEPHGGQWSFDEDNRKKLPADVEIPELPESRWSDHTQDVVDLVGKEFKDHPGCAQDFWWPVTRRAALYWLRNFLAGRLADFGPYQDAITQRSETSFHSVISPLLNVGLITPQDVIEQTLAYAADNDIPRNSLEGFIRQVIGWREFIRGIYHEFDEKQQKSNFWNHKRSLAGSWYTGDTGIPPLDDAIRSALRLGWTHHINRLMVVGNLMNLCEIEPRQVHDWFMETHIDSSDWVMGPNVYGMALYSDGGIFATKPYICGSNYLLKMSDYQKGDWCDVVDGLYWRFIEKHREFFAGNPRLSMMARMLDKLKEARRKRIFSAAEDFLSKHTD